MSVLRLSIVVAAIAALSSPALAKNVRWQCGYSISNSLAGLNTKDDLVLEFMVDDISGTAVVVGNAGMNNVAMHSGYLGVTFMEKLKSGAVQTTTINKIGGGSVHSRHSMSDTNPKMNPSQYYGVCKEVQ